jgi:TM2 domain-containing membrane protein YozV
MLKSHNFQGAFVAKKNLSPKICNICENKPCLNSEACPYCGRFVNDPVDKSILLPLTLFLGGLGIHKFYLCQKGQGLFYLLFFWTAIPTILSFFEFMVYMSASSEQLNKQYSAKSSILMDIFDVLGIIMAIGILAAIELPVYQNYTANIGTNIVTAQN